jgi:hypothetical protein
MQGSYYAFWDYWNLYHKVTFDGVNRLILINDGETEIDVQVDIYSAWKEWAQLESNLKYLKALDTVGGEPIAAGQRLDVTYFLINGWRIKPYPGTYSLNLVGNIFDVDGGDIKVPADIVRGRANNISLNTNTSVIVRQLSATNVEAGGLETDERVALFNIEDRVIAIESLLQLPITATLVQSQENALLDIQSKLTELWKIHGLDINNPMAVSKTGRLVDTIEQSFVEIATDTVVVTRQ